MSNSCWVYKKTEESLWTVGFYNPDGKFEPESDHDNREEAAKRVHYLNGGSESDCLNVKNQTGDTIDLCSGENEYTLQPNEVIAICISMRLDSIFGGAALKIADMHRSDR